MSKLAKSIPVKDLPEQVQLQFNVKTDGSKEPKYSQSDIFEAKKKAVKAKKSMPKSERLKRAKAEGVKASAKAQALNEKLREKGNYKYDADAEH
jgi:hypothetical protein